MENQWMSFKEAMSLKAWRIVQERYMNVYGVPKEVMERDYQQELKKLTSNEK